MTFVDLCSALPAAVTACNAEGIIIYINPTAERQFHKSGGCALLGSNIFECHPHEAQEKIRALMLERKSNVYTVEKNGQRRLIYQSPWYQAGEFAGLVEISFEIPYPIPHIVRK
jgi:PAS domain-containing protein